MLCLEAMHPLQLSMVHHQHLQLYMHMYTEGKGELFPLTWQVFAAMHMDCLQVAF